MKNKYMFIFLFFLYIFNQNVKSVDFKDKYNWGINGYVEYGTQFWLGKNMLNPLQSKMKPEVFMALCGTYNNKIFHSLELDLTNLRKNKVSEYHIKYIFNKSFNMQFGKYYPKNNLNDLNFSINKIFDDNLILTSIDNEMDFTTTFNYKKNTYNCFFSISSNKNSLNQETFKFRHFSYYFRFFKLLKINNKYETHIGFNINNVSYFNGLNNDGSIIQFLDTYEMYPALRTYPGHLLKYNKYGIEFIGLYNPIIFQIEYQSIYAHWRDFKKENYSNFYMQCILPLFGEERIYNFDTGSVVKTKKIMVDNSLELVLRYSYINITNRGFILQRVSTLDGKKINYMLGLNWYPHEKLKFQINYIKKSSKRRISEGRLTSNIYGINLQFVF